MTGRKVKLWEYRPEPPRLIEELPEPSRADLGVVIPDPPPTPSVLTDTVPSAQKAERANPRTTFDVCLELLATPLTRADAVERLVVTFRPEVREVQRQRWTTTVLDGSFVADAAADYLSAETIGLAAWAWDREERGLYNSGAWAWVETAKEVLERFSRLHAA